MNVKARILFVSVIGTILVSCILYGCFFIFSGNEGEEITKPPNTTITKYKGIWLPSLREVNISLRDIDSLKLDGVNIVAISVKICLEGDSIMECESEKQIRNAINEFHKNGIRVFLIINPAHPDFGINPFSSEASGKPLLDKITSIVLKWANISEMYGIEIFCPANEPQLLSYQKEKDVSDWAQELLPKLREIYHGKIGFRVQNMAEGFAVYNLTGYDYVVFGGLTCTKDIEENPGWVENIIKRAVNRLKEVYPGQKYIFFDCGAFTGPDYYWWEPVAPANMPRTMPDLPRDFFTVSNQSQAEFYDMFFNITWDETEGYFIPVYKGWEYRGKPAEKVIREWFNK